MEKIAVHCKDRDELRAVNNEVRNLSESTLDSFNEDTFRKGLCINIGQYGGWESLEYFQKQGYTIIPASEYLKGGNEVEFKVGDRVECINAGYMDGSEAYFLDNGSIYTIISVTKDRVELEECKGCSPFKKRFKLDNKINKQIKEEVMKENNINEKVLEVFGDEVKGSELVIIDRHYDMEMLEKILMAQFSGQIKTACKNAEKELKKEEKAKDKGAS